MKSLCCIYISIRKHKKFTENEYLKHRPRKVLFSEHVCFVQIYPIFAGPITYPNGMDMEYSLHGRYTKDSNEG